MPLIIRPSPAVAVRADETIGNCIRKMRDQKVGSLLVTSPDFRSELMGIFTERDILKHIDLIQHGRFWDHSISTVMTRPVQTIRISDLDQAGRRMMQYGFRHLPVVTEDEEGIERLLGVISMRDLFQRLLLETEKEMSPRVLGISFDREESYRVAVISRDKNFVRFLKHQISEGSASRALRLSLKEFLTDEDQFSKLKYYQALV